MNGLLVLCQLILVCVPYSPYVWGVQPGQIYNLEVALKKTYKCVHPSDLESSEIYKRETDNTQLQYNGNSSYTVLTNKNKKIDFTVKHIFVVLRNIIGIVAHPSNVNILLKFTNEQDAREMCVERHRFTSFSNNEFQIDKVLAADNILNEGIQVKEILKKGAIDMAKVESDPDDYFHIFTIHPTGEGPKPPVVMLVTDGLHVQPGPKSNFLVLEYQAGDGAFYFGLIFPTARETNRFVRALTLKNVKQGIEFNQLVREITMKLFQRYM